MSREIKFRAWNNKHKEMYYSHSAKKEKITEYQKMEIFFKVLEEYKQEFENPDQYTGLKDRNGKEIYEGDLISIVMRGGELSKPEIVQAEMGFNCGCCNNVYGWEMPDDFSQKGERVLVVGNIYENPELVPNDN